MQTQKTAVEAAAPAEAPGRGARRLLLGAGILILPALAWAVALLAVPAPVPQRGFQGPFVAPLTGQKVQVNLSDGKSFLILNLNLVYEACDEAYHAARAADPMYAAEIKDVLVEIASAKTREQVSDKVHKPVFMEEIRKAVEPLLFPVHIGETRHPNERDKLSGLQPGLSASRGTFRGPFGEHVLRVDAPARTLRIDDGPEITWIGGESEIAVVAADRGVLFVDVSRVEPGFRGELPVGVKGRVRKVLWDEVLIQ